MAAFQIKGRNNLAHIQQGSIHLMHEMNFWLHVIIHLKFQPSTIDTKKGRNNLAHTQHHICLMPHA